MNIIEKLNELDAWLQVRDSAPELLAALEGLVAYIEDSPVLLRHSAVFSEARAAIAKARAPRDITPTDW